jgi:restriction endonuclease Mrr
VPLEDLEGVALADAAVELLAQFERQGLVPIRQVLDAARRRGRLTGDPVQAQSALSASLRADNARKASAGQRQRFRFSAGRVGLTDWLLDGDLRRLEKDVFAAVERYREAVRRSLVRRIQGLPPRAIGELSMILLERLGIEEIQPVRRPGASSAELHLTGKAPGPVSPIATALVVRRDGRDVGREQVTDLRGSLHHFGPAFAGFIITTGQVLSGAREEAAAAGASPVRLVDGAALARLCEEHRVAVTETPLNLALPDMELFEALRNGNGG